MTVGVYDVSGVNLETARGSYPVTLTLSSSGVFAGTHSGQTSSGEVTFNSLRILSAGTFSITASSTSITSAILSSLSITNYVYSITLTPSSASASVNFSFNIAVILLGEDLNAFPGTCTITLAEATASLQGTTSLAITGGSGSMSVYLTSIGDKSIVATCPGISPSPVVTQTTVVTALQEIVKITDFTAVRFM